MKAGRFLYNMQQPKNHTYMGMKIPQHVVFEAPNWAQKQQETSDHIGVPPK